MKIIDLLNKIAKCEEVPKKVSINGGIHGIDVWEYDENCKDYLNSSNIMLLYSGMTSNHLTDEVEVLEEVEDKEYEDIDVWNENVIQDLRKDEEVSNWQIKNYISVLMVTQNQIIRNQKKIIEVLNDKVN